MSRVQRTDKVDVDGAINHARRRLRQELAAELTYHNLAHTFEHVLPTAMELADLCQVSAEDKMLLSVAVAFHDIGWIEQGFGHERIGADIVRDELPRFGFSAGQIERIANMILATQIPHQPAGLLDEILIDADMDLLGREDFWERNDELRAEIEALGETMTDREWYQDQLHFLKSHHYFTAAAIAMRESGKQQHIMELRRRLEAC